MFIIITGTAFSGRKTLQRYLVEKHGFTSLHVTSRASDLPITSSQPALSLLSFTAKGTTFALSYFRGRTLSDTAATPQRDVPLIEKHRLDFDDPSAMLAHVTKNWRSHFVTLDVQDVSVLTAFSRRPFCLIVMVDAPVLERFERCKRSAHIKPPSLERFLREHDRALYGQSSSRTFLQEARKLVNVQILNNYDTVAEYYQYLDTLNLLDNSRLRPQWDIYFMRLAFLTAGRSNCMKRRVGAIIVRNQRIIATGYNGTATGLINCIDGGCRRCNGVADTVEELDVCQCLHAEESALLEAGRERIGEGALLYCNTCPCLRCAVRIVQMGIKEVIYSLDYKV
ncbi:putative dCMP deaminase [Sistotremastrum suecicum HHB10207 ss-3]|uniref:Deoxycytidylate deaminase n=1 Tax=Sistotremastrum suecicum HHB10207 ss-3 TaxID=1314776 RepID=A0A166J339_9AGAM|nr:putative dCMP deaminase [Sistotremastrum suecicum HHB10207 ss-3]